MRIRSCAYLSLFAVLVPLPTVCVADKKTDVSDIKVFIFTAGPDEGELVTPQTVARHKEALDSVEDLKKQLAKKLEVTDKRDGADVTIEVLARGAVKPGTTTPSRDTTKDGGDGVHVSWPPAITEPSLRVMAPMVRLLVREQRPRKTSATKSKNGSLVIIPC